ncbi:LysM peptidoglycan-binding domain-containing protein [Coriobacteriia bacterium Es71-Z0120]|uniref:LysM peptidoglycan-binding domain-containing protein n=1 Tax=Parvivirga hydrogeniphila TaxID=2939460 RepID=UPI002260DC56|nr:LysM peptidoglycan-binding domain-containing protein [Parvivirga hydrogeniphila]MCL4079633.1 LysM peptidoglycan-binding domain-containing protein [Parvivirga hydrogeniphila]
MRSREHTRTRREPRCAVTLEMLGAVLSLALLIAAIVHAAGAAATPPTDVKSVTIVVQRGDTLWSIARRCAVPGDTIPEKVAAIRAANGLHSASLSPGQSLSIPVIGDDAGRDRVAEASELASRDGSGPHETR